MIFVNLFIGIYYLFRQIDIGTSEETNCKECIRFRRQGTSTNAQIDGNGVQENVSSI